MEKLIVLLYSKQVWLDKLLIATEIDEIFNLNQIACLRHVQRINWKLFLKMDSYQFCCFIYHMKFSPRFCHAIFYHFKNVLHVLEPKQFVILVRLQNPSSWPLDLIWYTKLNNSCLAME